MSEVYTSRRCDSRRHTRVQKAWDTHLSVVHSITQQHKSILQYITSTSLVTCSSRESSYFWTFIEDNSNRSSYREPKVTIYIHIYNGIEQPSTIQQP